MPNWLSRTLWMLVQAAAIGGLMTLPAQSDPSARDVLLRPIAPYGTDYLSGLTDGLAWTNAKGTAPLYCPPPSVSIVPAQYREILRRKVESDTSLAGAPAGYVLLRGLIDTFPCAGKP